MKFTKRIGALAMCLLLLCVTMLLGACGSEQASGSAGGSEVNYQVKVVDGSGNPYSSGVIVQFMQNGEKVALQTVNEAGVAEKSLPKGDYTVELMFTGDASEYYYDNTGLTLSADANELEIVLAKNVAGEAQMLFADGKEYEAYAVSEGSSHVNLTVGDRAYFLFTPSIAGTYRVSASDASAQVGYYGAPHFVQSVNAAEVVDGAITISVSASMIGTDGAGTTVLVLGVDAGEADNCVLTIQRIGEAERTLADEPWSIYQTTVEVSPYKLPSGAELVDFDITASTDTYNLVLNEKDGFYHLDSADGPLVLMYLGEDVQYLDCFKTILDHTGVNRYFFDENGEFVKKENYVDCLLEYIAGMDEDNGVYPLTEDLKYILQMEGEDSGWFDPDGAMYLFVDDNGNFVDGINNEISWLFMCCYIAN